jgi:hypothetical protein
MGKKIAKKLKNSKNKNSENNELNNGENSNHTDVLVDNFFSKSFQKKLSEYYDLFSEAI